MEKKGPFTVKELKSLSPGTQIRSKYIVLEKVDRKTKDGRDFMNLNLGDATGNIDVIAWDTCNVSGNVEKGLVIGILGDLALYNNRLQINAKLIKVMEGEDVTPYLKGPPVELNQLEQEFDKLLASITDVHINKLLHTIFTLDVKAAFMKTPAAKKIHHNYPGGLLEHTIQVANICASAASLYPVLNRDLLIAGAILHDIGKLAEYEIKVLPEYTTSGRLVGHIVLGHEMVDNAIRSIRQADESFPENLEMMIKHMVLSHHGTMEFGSPVIPLFPEAFLLHMADNLDAKLFVFINKIEEEEAGEDLFTAYDSFFAQHFFKYRYEGE